MSAKRLTDAQDQALKKAWEILCEHFDRVIIAYETENLNERNEVFNTFDCNYHGGLSSALGLCDLIKETLLHPAEEEDD